MESSLPPEIWHRIFRKLQPSTFYSILPRVSKTWLVNQCTAAPGNDGKVGVAITLVICRYIPENFLLYLPDLRYLELADIQGLALVDIVAPMYQFSVDDRSDVQRAVGGKGDRTVTLPRWNAVNAEIAVDDSFFMRRSPHLAEDILRAVEILVASVLGLSESRVTASVQDLCISRDGFHGISGDPRAVRAVQHMTRNLQASFVATNKLSRQFLKPWDFPGMLTYRGVFVTTWKEVAEIARDLEDTQHLEIHTYGWDLTREESLDVPEEVQMKTTGATWDAPTDFEPFPVLATFPKFNELGTFPLDRTGYILSHRSTTPAYLSTRFGVLTDATLKSKNSVTMHHAISFITWGQMQKCEKSGTISYNADLTFDSPKLLSTALAETSPCLSKVVLQLDVGTIPDLPLQMNSAENAKHFHMGPDSQWSAFFQLMPGSEYFKIIFISRMGMFNLREHLDCMVEEIKCEARRHGRTVFFELGGKGHYRYYNENELDRYADLDDDRDIYD
ncbi:hypothetical protein M427DRAFT_30445 [Gonapodya prolifera JEL478]|uniref:F-box domain-containing protein n=1 Tax=Gonapodya prolifera (strain JEL478) TaxID=1344416 RepID=A0A139ALA5_GONPJ|nr:hypothetical protein M427DRAFT_30445 [Gonapodya prolifera JEL478]|eukprot:KXS17293.1 hypothetical protein M427DRAFT_30445 [Gonapodya prolifera JEL478]